MLLAMFRADSADRWQWSEDVSLPLDFCVRALRRDGLPVAPFDRHPDGDHSLRERGLTADAWRGWLEAVLAAGARLGAHVGDPRWLEDRALLAQLGESAMTPARLCPGTAELRARLEELWAGYQPEGERWKREMTTGKRHDWFPPRHERWLWRALVPLRPRLETLSVFLVDYPVPAVMTFPPTACVIAQDPSNRDGSSYAAMVLRAAEELAALRDAG